MPNRLAQERSPYLLQHALNPVDWFPWGEEAFAAARRDDKPIFLSIGYSTCHWCHVMEHESFEDPAIADALNRHFVSIKVDREERPDLDRVYMAFVQATTGAGGWPMSVWLTPDLQPFFGGTYFPPESRWGRPGFIDVLMQLARAWQTDRARVSQSAGAMLEELRRATGADEAAPDRGSVAGVDAVAAGIDAFAGAYDARRGGFGGAPKFPRPSELLFLMNAHALTGDRRAREMAVETLRAMALGGLRDHVGGGFHRYSVDGDWRVPHFEKMLYDQAQLVLAYLEAAQLSGEDFYAAVAEDTLDYVRRDLTSQDGGFWSAEDADSFSAEFRVQSSGSVPSPESVPGAESVRSPESGEKREGAFYVWDAAEIDRLLGDDAPVVRRRFGIRDDGNAPSDPQGEFRGKNLLYVAESIEDIAVRTGVGVEVVMAALRRARAAMFRARESRPRPHLDDKVIAAWNGLMIAAFARAARQLVDSPKRDEWRRAAERAAAFVRARLWDPETRRLRRRFRQGDAAIDAFCEDYACLAWGVIELFQATGDARWLDWARELTETQAARFFDERDGGWFSTAGDDPSVLLRMKEDYDGAEPAAASVTVRNLIRLGQITGDRSYLDRAQRTFERYGSHLGRVARVMPLMTANLALWHARRAEVVIVGRRDREDFRALEREAASIHFPAAVVVPVDERAPVESRLALPWVAAMRTREGAATAYVCYEFACQAPATEPPTLAAQLADASAARRIVL